MENCLGMEWFTNVFIPNCGESRPQLLLLDSHSSDEVLELLEVAREERIHVFALPPQTTQQLQPLDTNIFMPFKSSYNRACSRFMTENPSRIVDKKSFPLLFNEAWQTLKNEDLIRGAFCSTGIHPPNPSAISMDAFMPARALDRPHLLEPAPEPILHPAHQLTLESAPEIASESERAPEPIIHPAHQLMSEPAFEIAFESEPAPEPESEATPGPSFPNKLINLCLKQLLKQCLSLKLLLDLLSNPLQYNCHSRQISSCPQG